MTEIWSGGLKKTKQRESVVSILGSAEKPMTAFEIHGEAVKAGTELSLSTVYRILELLTSKGITIKNLHTGDDMASYELAGNCHKHYAVCVSCRKKIPIEGCPIGSIGSTDDFHVTGHKLEMLGYCGACYVDKIKEGSL